ncbi:nucleotidyl transferase AbiEii/AbiGii toxin family protein [Agrobacterium tumefaciens]|uniref:nucleotidyl transferase AbiEii/AbiGii toxin family protein n=1 Tax=Agrobacterium tumefaciens TaxID=358 RepID=UPI000DDD0C4D|nr:nucleotidyl transferase AbiEii/AbiGii toxin family protein [Agrobacterium tumefaciens]MBP2537501.1 putative nucleotidyltransferase component of viral defense system [Agrobacterium tumefaciens]MDP9791025.1 putative nucleotidyltransferase component of viral defense system [Agrobacterium tumefaciens]
MIPAQNIVAWGSVVRWADERQVEQDLIISRAIIDIFNDDLLSTELRFRGGTALNKLHFPEPLRYSEDIDLVRTTAGPIGPILDRLREVLEPWLGRAQFDQSPVAPKFRFRVDAEDGSGVPIRLKVEINTREIEAYTPPQALPFRIDNPWFAGEAAIPTFSREEMLATKLRALLQRDKGRDLYDLSHALTVFTGLDANLVTELFGRYLQFAGQSISRAQAEERMFAKLANPRLLTDMRPLLPSAQAEALSEDATKNAFERVFEGLVVKIAGDTWVRTGEMIERFGLGGPPVQKVP